MWILASHQAQGSFSKLLQLCSLECFPHSNWPKGGRETGKFYFLQIFFLLQDPTDLLVFRVLQLPAQASHDLGGQCELGTEKTDLHAGLSHMEQKKTGAREVALAGIDGGFQKV